MQTQPIVDASDRLFEVKESIQYIALTFTKEPIQYAGVYWVLMDLAKKIEEQTAKISEALKSK